jgi:hypothetical protein
LPVGPLAVGVVLAAFLVGLLTVSPVLPFFVALFLVTVLL